jgi:hypothetical protein
MSTWTWWTTAAVASAVCGGGEVEGEMHFGNSCEEERWKQASGKSESRMALIDRSPEEDIVHELRSKVEKTITRNLTQEASFPSSGSTRKIFRTTFRICRPLQVGRNSITHTSMVRVGVGYWSFEARCNVSCWCVLPRLTCPDGLNGRGYRA